MLSVFFFFSFLFSSFARSTCLGLQTKKILCVRQKGVLTFSKHRAVSLLHTYSFSLNLSYTSVVNELPPKPPSPVDIRLNRYPLCRLRFRTFVLHLFTFVLLFAHTHTQIINHETTSSSCILFHVLNPRTTTLSLSEFSIGCSYFL